jgi:outer membrane protein assembly factor BamB
MGEQRVRSVALTPEGDAVIAGSFTGTVNVRDKKRDAAGLLPDPFVVKLSAAGGAAPWMWTAGDGDAQVPTSVAVGPKGQIVVAGAFRGAINLGNTVLENSDSASDHVDAFVVALGANGEPTWAKSFSGLDSQAVTSVALDADGNVIVAGAFSATIDINGTKLESANLRDAFVAKLSGADGATIWARTLGGAGESAAWATAVDAEGGIFVGGTFKGALSLSDAATYDSPQRLSAFLAKLAP